MKNLALTAGMVVLLSACSEPYDFEGRYFVATGDECSLEDNMKTENNVFLQITAQGKGENKTYAANIPVAAAWGLPASSNATASPTENEELNFTFSKDEKVGWVSSSPGVDMSMKVIPHESRENHLWLTKWHTSVSQNGTVNQTSVLDKLAKGDPRYSNIPKITEKGACLIKQS